MSSALVIHPGALGDVLLAVPALRALRAAGQSITVAAQPRIGALLVALGVAEHAVAFDTLGLETLFTDAALSPTAPLTRHLAEVSRVICWFGARDAHFARRLRALAPDVVVSPATTTTTAVWKHLLGTVAGTADCTPITVTADDALAGREALRAAGWDGASRVLVLHPGAGGVAKRWATEGFAAAIDGIAATVVVHEGPADGDAVRSFLARAHPATLRLAYPSLTTLAGALSLATAYLGNDSGISHLAAAVGTPSVILFTEATLPWQPWSPTTTCVTITTTTPLESDRTAVTTALKALL